MKLLPCPFCGCAEVFLDSDHIDFWVTCCKCDFRNIDSEQSVIEQWNTRVESAELASLREEVERLKTTAYNIAADMIFEARGLGMQGRLDAAQPLLAIANVILARFGFPEVEDDDDPRFLSMNDSPAENS